MSSVTEASWAAHLFSKGRFNLKSALPSGSQSSFGKRALDYQGVCFPLPSQQESPKSRRQAKNPSGYQKLSEVIQSLDFRNQPRAGSSPTETSLPANTDLSSVPYTCADLLPNCHSLTPSQGEHADVRKIRFENIRDVASRGSFNDSDWKAFWCQPLHPAWEIKHPP